MAVVISTGLCKGLIQLALYLGRGSLGDEQVLDELADALP